MDDDDDDVNGRKSFWLKQGLEPATAGFPLSRLTYVLWSDKKKLATVIVGYFCFTKSVD